MTIASARREFGFRSLLFSGVAAIALSAAAVEAHAEAQDFFNRPHWWLSVEGRALRASGESQPWAHNDPVGGFTLGTSFLETVRINRAWSGKVTAGVRVNNLWDFALAYTGLLSANQTDSADTTARCALVPVVSRYRSCYHVGTAQIRTTMHYGDFEAGYNMGLGGAQTRLFAGVRILHWRQSLTTQFTPFGITDEERIARFFGAGPRIGVQGQYPVVTFGPGTFSLTGTVAGSVLFGNAHDEASSFSRQASTQLRTFYSRDRFSTVGNVEGRLGIDYTFANIPVSLSFGYHVEAFFGLVNTRTAPPPYVGFIAASFAWPENGTRRGNQVFHGPFFNFTARF
jgi:hypothetical protein